ncbi:MAG: hypothetical protein JNL51_14345 [Chitinophagaceae bacterium]|nr:hypothetical protein [Chitinophagaceae bacterium]
MRLIFWSGVIMLIGSIALIVNNYNGFKVERSGVLVKMRIKKLPNSCLGTKVKHFVTLSYTGENYIKMIGGKFCDEHNIGELIDMKYLEGSPIVLFPKESVLRNLISFGILGLLGLGMIVYQLTKSKR